LFATEPKTPFLGPTQKKQQIRERGRLLVNHLHFPKGKTPNTLYARELGEKTTNKRERGKRKV
jgi:hypothetical protein